MNYIKGSIGNGETCYVNLEKYDRVETFQGSISFVNDKEVVVLHITQRELEEQLKVLLPIAITLEETSSKTNDTAIIESFQDTVEGFEKRIASLERKIKQMNEIKTERPRMPISCGIGTVQKNIEEQSPIHKQLHFEALHVEGGDYVHGYYCYNAEKNKHYLITEYSQTWNEVKPETIKKYYSK